MELLAPAGNLEKLKYACLYGADAAYMGIRGLSLRAKADNIGAGDYEEARRLKGDKKLYAAVNMAFRHRDLPALEAALSDIPPEVFDAFIVSDLGSLPLVRKRFPGTPLHLSTQANCLNAEAVKIYRDLGFSRIILGREASLEDIADIKQAVPDMELEVFVHGAMCLSYSGRCYLSAYMAGRSANRGLCSHPCRWNYRVLEEQERPGEYYPVIEGDGFTTILSSKDLCMIDHLKELADTGVDALKIEGRMKSIYYTAVVTAAYRKALDDLAAGRTGDPEGLKRELFKVSHREFGTGFFFSREDADTTTSTDYTRSHMFLGTIDAENEPGVYAITVKNQIRSGEPIEYVGPGLIRREDNAFTLLDQEDLEVEKADHGKPFRLKPGVTVQPGFIIRKKINRKDK